MKIITTRFGTISVNKNKIIHMPSGMLGFSEKKRFVLFRHKENSPFFWYQSVDEPSLAFVVTSPFLFVPEYSVDADDAAKAMLWNDAVESDLELYVVANIPKGEPDKMTANLIGPILINVKKRQAVQMVISNSPYSHKFPITDRK
ncbi:MAG: flagellar assembly protein FliW [bacterium]